VSGGRSVERAPEIVAHLSPHRSSSRAGRPITLVHALRWPTSQCPPLTPEPFPFFSPNPRFPGSLSPLLPRRRRVFSVSENPSGLFQNILRSSPVLHSLRQPGPSHPYVLGVASFRRRPDPCPLRAACRPWSGSGGSVLPRVPWRSAPVR
jgi:hypothetical protein